MDEATRACEITDRPVMTSFLPVFWATRASASILLMLDEKIATKSLPGVLEARSMRFSETSLSSPAGSSSSAPVESPIIRSTPLRPKDSRRSSVDRPPSGPFNPSLKSPVCRMLPAGVSMKRPMLSMIEWGMGMLSTENGPVEIFPPGSRRPVTREPRWSNSFIRSLIRPRE